MVYQNCSKTSHHETVKPASTFEMSRFVAMMRFGERTDPLVGMSKFQQTALK
jgi:hypothetical protein